MGQYHLVCNIDRKELLHPWAFGDGLKLIEFCTGGIMAGLAVLLAGSVRGGCRGGGDFCAASPLALAIAGRWAGDRIAIVGDYVRDGDVRGVETDALTGAWDRDGTWVDISEHVVAVMAADRMFKHIETRGAFTPKSGIPHRSTYDLDTDAFLFVADPSPAMPPGAPLFGVQDD